MTDMEIQIVVPNERAAKNFAEWFRREGFDAFTKSKYNKYKKNDDTYITCLATDEELGFAFNNEYGGQFIELQ